MALYQSGMAAQLQAYHEAGGIIFGICGGLQMLGRLILDPEHRESPYTEAEGLNLLPLKTIITAEKITCQRQVLSNYPQIGLPVTGYEIHQGVTEWESESGYQKLFEGDATLGIVNDSLSIWGCYLHGIFDNSPWRRSWLNHLRQRRGLLSLPTGIANYCEQREIAMDTMANLVEQHLNLKPIFAHL
jgi:adenosylcobyric acid synthase